MNILLQKHKKNILIIFIISILILTAIFIYEKRIKDLKSQELDKKSEINLENVDFVSDNEYKKYEFKNDDIYFTFLYKKDFQIKNQNEKQNEFSLENKDGKTLSNIYILNKNKYGNMESYIKNFLMSSESEIKEIKFANDDSSTSNSIKYILNNYLSVEYFVQDLNNEKFLIIENEELNDDVSSLATRDLVRSLEVK
jgi:hypothetical protein